MSYAAACPSCSANSPILTTVTNDGPPVRVGDYHICFRCGLEQVVVSVAPIESRTLTKRDFDNMRTLDVEWFLRARRWRAENLPTDDDARTRRGRT